MSREERFGKIYVVVSECLTFSLSEQVRLSLYPHPSMRRMSREERFGKVPRRTIRETPKRLLKRKIQHKVHKELHKVHNASNNQSYLVYIDPFPELMRICNLRLSDVEFSFADFQLQSASFRCGICNSRNKSILLNFQ